MHASPSFVALALAAFARFVSAQNYTLQTSLSGASFFEHFTFFTGADPTDGFVDYVDMQTALANDYIALSNHSLANNSIYIGVDHSTVLSSSSTTGRQSVRISGTDVINHGLITIDVYHSPVGCGLWPAIWMLNPNGTYPGTTGEIDIMEGVHNWTNNAITLHTSEGCTISNTTTAASDDVFSTTTSSLTSASTTFSTAAASSSDDVVAESSDGMLSAPRLPGSRRSTDTSESVMYGTITTSDCWTDAPDQSDNTGCSIAAPDNITVATNTSNANTYATSGYDFNDANGGVLALVWTSTAIEEYFFPRALVPSELVDATEQGRTVDPSTWRSLGFEPVASFAGCDFDDHLADLSMIMNTDFCGSWAGAVWDSYGCAASTGVSTCDAYVAENPAAFTDAYWLIGGIALWNTTDAA